MTIVIEECYSIPLSESTFLFNLLADTILTKHSLYQNQPLFHTDVDKYT